MDKVSDEIEGWASAEGPRTLGGLVDLFGEKGFAIVFILLLAVPALPLPTGGATHLFEVIAMLLALQLIVGRHRVWLPKRWRRIRLDGEKQDRFVKGLTRWVRRVERLSRPRLSHLFGRRVSNLVFGVLVLLLSIGAFVAPPFSGLDTLPALGAVVISVGVLLEDIAVVVVGIAIGATGIALDIVLGRAAFSGLKHLFSTLRPPPA